MDTAQLTRRIKERAAQLGFAACGVAKAERLPVDRLTEWLALGYHATMDYLARNVEKRVDPGALLPGARSVLSLALIYKREDSGPEASQTELRGKISSYARGTDYHLVLERRLAALLSFIRELAPEAKGRCLADATPLLEKEWAVRAGIGWQAKNTNALSRTLGSWFFLGEILLDVDLEYDQPIADHCGSCTRCIDACPTGALAPYVLDSRRCISYLTIELREDAPVEFRAQTANLIFGCDICQDVCPWNRKAPFSDDPELAPDPQVAETDLLTLSNQSPEEFVARYRESAIKRAKWRGLMRNVAIALGNSRNPAAIAPLARLLETDDAMVRRQAAWGLARIGGESAYQALSDRRGRETDAATLRTLEELLLPPARQGRSVP